ncbi:MAG TPA: hypothetical protein DD490_06250 [Acidobacteria bacterium]|nr:hypothetical protein [Acidobacteriota bacterium]
MIVKRGSASGARRALWALGVLAGLVPLGAAPARAAGSDFYTVTPCRLLDTRLTAGPLGGPALAANASRAIAAGGQCGVSTAATAIAANVTVLPQAAGYLTIGANGSPKPLAATITFSSGVVRSNNAVLPLGTGGGILAWSGTGADLGVVLDVTGYFMDGDAAATQVAPPAFNPPPGSYNGEQTVSLVSSTPGATIRYTTDGSTPSASNGTVLSGSISLTGSTTLRAIAYKAGMTDSAVTVGSYTIVRQEVLFVATLTPQNGAISLGTGQATLLLAADEQTAVLRHSFSNLSTTLTAAHIHAPDGQIVFDLDTATPAADGSLTWTIVSTGAWSRTQILDALRAGQCYLNLHSVTYPNGEIKGYFRIANGSITFTPPPAPPALPGGPPTSSDAARFLTQATYGPTPEAITALQAQGLAPWIEAQFNQPLVSHVAYVNALPVPAEDRYSWYARESIWKQAIQGPDQLRQRVALALSELFVVSSEDSDLSWAESTAAYMDLLNRNAFGNFRTLLTDVTLSPAMGVYLDMLSNDKEDPETGRNPNENYAREILQLFAVGLYKLHPDGTLQLDNQGLPIETYDQEVIKGLAKVFTGWTFAGQDHSQSWRFYWPEQNWLLPMEVWPEHHSTGSKQLLNGVLQPANQTPQADLNAALDNVFQHANVGPFVCKHLIQRLVTSNPSPAYVYRCGQAFANNGQGVRGDMKAVLRTILLDWEARTTTVLGQQGFGKVREPMVRFVTLLRALKAQPPADGRFRYYWQASAEWGLNQAPLQAPTVFNFFDPTYSQPGVVAEAGLASPELQITNETSVFGTANFLHSAIEGYADDNTEITLDYSYLTGAGSDAVLLDRVNLLFYSGLMSTATRTTFAQALADPDFPTQPLERAQTLVWLVSLSPEFVVQR